MTRTTARRRPPAGSAPQMEWSGFRTAVESQVEALPALAGRLQEQLAGEQWALPVRRVVAIGIGASHGALQIFATRLEARGIVASVRTGANGPGPIDPEAWYVAVSQSGRSTEVLAAMETVPPGRRIAVVNHSDSPLAVAAGRILDLGGLPDSRVSTIGFTGTVVALEALADRLAGAPSRGLFLPDLDAFSQRCQAWAGAVGPMLRAARATDLIGSGDATGVVEAGALLLREGAHLPASGYDTRSYLHGYMDSASERTVHLIIDGARERVLIRQLREAGAQVVRLGGEQEQDDPDLPIPEGGLAARTVTIALALQHLVLEHAAATGQHPEDSVFERLDTKVPR